MEEPGIPLQAIEAAGAQKFISRGSVFQVIIVQKRCNMRRRDREVTDIDEILRIVDKAKILHLGLFDTDYPYIVPLHYGYEYRDGNLIFYHR